MIGNNILESLMAAVRRAEQFLGPKDDWVEDDRRILFEAAQRRLGHLHRFTREKKGADYFTTVDADSDAVEQMLSAGGYQRNLISTRKYRTHHEGGKQSGEPLASPNGSPDGRPSGRQWAVGSWVLDPADTDWQHHVFLFPAPDGGTDLYGHLEPSVREGIDHLSSIKKRGDYEGRVRGILSAKGLTPERRKL